MASQWYYAQGGVQHGPVTTQRLKELAASCELAATDLVWKEGLAEWRPASTLKGLFLKTQDQRDSPPPLPTTERVDPSPIPLLASKRSPHVTPRVAIGLALVIIAIVGLIVTFAWPTGGSGPLAGIGADATIPDEEGDAMITLGMTRWISAMDQLTADLKDGSDARVAKSEAREAELKAEADAIIVRCSASHRALLEEAAGYFEESPRDIYLIGAVAK